MGSRDEKAISTIATAKGRVPSVSEISPRICVQCDSIILGVSARLFCPRIPEDH